MAEQHVEKKHSKLGASTCSRWWACPGSVRLAEPIPRAPSSKYADRGTAAHWVIEKCLANDYDPAEYIGETYETDDNVITINEEDTDAVQEFLNVVNQIDEDEFGEDRTLHIEVKFNLKTIHPTLFGTADVVMYDPDCKKLVVIDYKHGAGVPVSVEHNKQLMYYALGAISFANDHEKLDLLDIVGFGQMFRQVELIVVQPRCKHGGDTVKRWIVPSHVLQQFADELKPRARSTEDPLAILHTGDHCRWCPVNDNAQGYECPEHRRVANQTMGTDFAIVQSATLVLPEVIQLSTADRSRIYKMKTVIDAWFKGIGASLQADLLNGQDVIDFKLVRTSPHRKWTDPGHVWETLKQSFLVEDFTKLNSPSQIENLAKEQGVSIDVASLCHKPQGVPVMAPEQDRRKAMIDSCKDDYDNLLTEDDYNE